MAGVAIEARPQIQPPGIMGSTGEVGVSRRGDNRLYINAKYGPVGVDQLDALAGTFGQAVRITEKMGPKSRAVLRTAVDDDAAQQLFSSDHPLFSQIEFAVPTTNLSAPEGRRWLVGFGKNGSERRNLADPRDILRNTSPESYSSTPKSALTRIEGVLEKGYTVTDQITEDILPQVFNLWKDTFGWEGQEVINLAKRLQDQQSLPPHERKVWFTGIMDGKELVAVSMAERLDLPLGNDNLTLVESTEWKSIRKKEGLLAAAAAGTHAQVLQDLQGLNPFIYAECRYQSRADLAAHGVGMEMPPRIIGGYDGVETPIIIPQALMQNVEVDGQLSDFTYWHLSPEGIAQYYPPQEVDRIAAIIRK
jgi:hypothetical protein